MVFAERVENRIPDLQVRAKSHAQFLDINRVSGIQRPGNLVDIIANTADMPQDFAKRPVVGRRAALGTGSGIAVEGGGPEVGGKSEAGIVRLGGDSIEFVFRKAGGTPLVPLSFFAARCHWNPLPIGSHRAVSASGNCLAVD